ncbi:MAG: glycosyltransferase family 39 protein [Flavobacteriales bacterium]|nr:glycosyltransferase family 39 protein [Flavobacteriales bacterium]
MTERAFRLALSGIVLVTVAGAGLDLMEVDAAQYASMSRDMVGSGDWTHLYHRGQDYLDKPPLLFWTAALSYELFGVANWSYKLPSILFAFLGMFSLYRFTALYHGTDIARTTTLMFGSSAAFLLMTNDVRCDTILTGSVITAIWLGMAWIEQRRWWQLIGCGVAIGAGMLAKGPMGLMAPGLAIGGHVLLARRWDVLRDPRILVLLPVIALLLFPMCLGLYEQHGAHGVRFYFWEQSFGRLTGENRWKDDSTPFFFTHELPWQVLPWTPFVLVGLWYSVLGAMRRNLSEYASLSGALLVFIAISFSQFKLPHYLYVALPLFMIMGGLAFHRHMRPWLRVLDRWVIMLLWGVAMLISAWSFPDGRLPFVALLVLVPLVLLLLRTQRLLATFWVMITIGCTINAHIYPQLLRYQANAQAGKWAAERGLGKGRFYGMQVSGTALDLYAGHAVQWLSDVQEARPVIAPGVVIYTDPVHRARLIEAGFAPVKEIELPDYRVQLLGIEMLLPAERARVLEKRYLMCF